MRATYITMIITAVITLTACNAPQDNKIEDLSQPHETVTIGDTVAAFYLNPSSHNEIQPDGQPNPGYVILMDNTGAFTTIRTNGMQEAHMAWSQTGLFFTDINTDYILNEQGLTTFDNPKASRQSSAFALPNGNGFIGIYNDGFTDNGYNNHVTVTTTNSAKRYDVEGNYFMNTLCDNTLYGISTDPGQYMSEAATIPDMTAEFNDHARPEIMSQLYPSVAGGEQVVGWRAAFDASDNTRRVPCVEGVAVFLSTFETTDGDVKAVVAQWDTVTGEVVEHDITDNEGTIIDPKILEFRTFDDQSLNGDTLQWLASDGVIMGTNINTGATTPLFATGFPNANFSSTKVAFTDGSLFTLHDAFTTKEPLVFAEFDRDTGEQLSSVNIEGITEHMGMDLVLRDMVVAPDS